MKSVDFWWVDDLIDHIEFGAHSRTDREYRRLAALGEASMTHPGQPDESESEQRK